MRITVYASSSPQTPSIHLAAARRLGQRIAAGGHVLVNGAGASGCMGALNDACLAAGGQVEGVILRQFMDQGLGHAGLSRIAVADTMRERKRLLAAGSAAFLVLPGGPGTWEELWEVAVERQIGVTTAPVVVINIAGYYAGFLEQLHQAAADGFLYGPAEDLVQVVATPEEACDLIGLEENTH